MVGAPEGRFDRALVGDRVGASGGVGVPGARVEGFGLTVGSADGDGDGTGVSVGIIVVGNGVGCLDGGSVGTNDGGFVASFPPLLLSLLLSLSLFCNALADRFVFLAAALHLCVIDHKIRSKRDSCRKFIMVPFGFIMARAATQCVQFGDLI